MLEPQGLALLVGAAALLAAGAPLAATRPPAPPPPKPAVVAAPAGDPLNGKKRFKAICESCHFAMKDATVNDMLTKIGPNLYGVVDRKAGTLKGFSYSRTMKSSGVVWTRQALKPYLLNPQKTLPNVRMAFKGVPNPKDADDIIAYLATLK